MLLLAFPATVQGDARGMRKDVGDDRQRHRALKGDSKKGKGGCLALSASQVCGQTFGAGEEVTLGDSIDCGDQNGPTLEDGAVLNCDGNTISTDVASISSLGVNVADGGGTVKNCKFSGFFDCIFIDDTTPVPGDVKIENVQVTDCSSAGLTTLGNNDSIELKGFTAVGNRDGIRQSGGTFSKLEDVTLCENTRDDLGVPFFDPDTSDTSIDNLVFTRSFNQEYLALRTGTCEDEASFCPVPAPTP